MNKADIRLNKKRYLDLARYGTSFNLSFSSQLALGKKLIGLDAMKKRLLMLDTAKEGMPRVIDLNKVAAIVVHKIYGSIDHRDLRHKKVDDFLEKVDLRFVINDAEEKVVLPFYDSREDDKRSRPLLEKSAEKWQKMLSKLLGKNPGGAKGQNNRAEKGINPGGPGPDPAKNAMTLSGMPLTP